MITQIRTVLSSSLTVLQHWLFDFKGESSLLPTREQLLGIGLQVKPLRKSSRSTTVCWAQWLVVLQYVSVYEACVCHAVLTWLRVGLSVLARVPWNAMSASRTSAQATYFGSSSLKDSCKPRLLLQGHGLKHGNDVRWRNATRGTSTVLH